MIHLNVSNIRPLESIGWFVLHCLLFSFISILTKYVMLTGISIVEVLAFQTFFACVFLILFKKNIWRNRPSNKMVSLHALRALFWLVATAIFFKSLDVVSLAKATSLSFSTPLFTIIFAIIMLKEVMNKGYIIPLCCGFIGMLIILRPGFEGYSPESLFILVACVLWSVTDIMIKNFCNTDDNINITYFFSLFSFLLLVPILPEFWTTPDLEQFVILLVIAVLFLLNILSITNAYRLGNMTIIQPFAFTNLIFIAILSYIAFDEVITMPTIIGAVVIILSTTFIVMNERKISRKL